MKKFFNIVLMLNVISIVFIGCTSNPAKEATEKYIRENGNIISSILFYVDDVNARVSVVQWNNTPIDTITYGDFYLYELKKRIKEANEYKRKTLHSDSTKVKDYRKRLNSYHNDDAIRELYQDWLYDALESQKTHQKEYDKMVHNIKVLKDYQGSDQSAEPLFYVYMFTEKLQLTKQATKERTERVFTSYSYLDLRKQSVVYVDEAEENYEPKFDKLPSPFVEENFQEEELELI